MNNQKKMWDWMGLFVIALVISIPFYVADVHAASIAITTNYGDDKIKGFLDADGDTWVVEAAITGASNGTVDPKNVKMNVKGNLDSFDSCSNTALGSTCKYLSPVARYDVSWSKIRISWSKIRVFWSKIRGFLEQDKSFLGQDKSFLEQDKRFPGAK